ncbi:MAG: T9SS type A sorting domain-containing protein [Saprospiraceae bacterium]|nr:T9SS type A sorting domain-containing protein [Saprospiraceae bacterium]
MNKLLLFTCLMLLSGACASYAQTANPPFPVANAYWEIQLGCFEPFDRDSYTCGDSLIDGKHYSELYTDFRFAGSGVTLSRGWLRRDGDKVLFRTKPDTPEYPIYDFALQANDTATLKRNFFDFNNTIIELDSLLFRVLKVDSVMLPGGWHKRWTVDCLNYDYDLPNETWIAGMGSTFGPVDRFLCALSGTPARVRCFWRDGEIIYTQFPQNICEIEFPAGCQVITGTSLPGNGAGHLSAFPNPFSDRLTLEADFDVPGDALLNCFDATGRKKQVTWSRDGQQITIDRGTLPPGLYFFSITTRYGRMLSAHAIAN